MSDCCNYPGVGTKPEGLSKSDYASYNPSEVRLYGRPAKHQDIFPLSDDDIKKMITDKINYIELSDENLEKLIKDIREIAALRVAGDSVFSMVNQQIVLAIVDNKMRLLQLPVEINIPSRNFRSDDGRYIKSIGVIYGYAYEGHCYKLPKPQIMYLPEEAHVIEGGDCGCDCGYVPELGYAVWQIDKLERVVALDVRSDDLKTLVLDENMPGNRSPLAYAQTMALAPQRQRD
ncbi:UNVERIFIED_ORG: hypothetical protein J2W85_001142 [Ensifer adhaerens]|nr:hypothetical protein [Ensifer adhaerens]